MGAVVAQNNNMATGNNNNNNVPRQAITAPYQMQHPNLPTTAPRRRPIRKVFRSKCYCITCGWMKREHTVSEGKGKKPMYCTREYCGNCYNLKSYHVQEGIPFGKDCTATTNTFCYENVNDWYTYTVR